jgi:RsiW-degrading membrane proteinase PrsW (M82 family)
MIMSSETLNFSVFATLLPLLLETLYEELEVVVVVVVMVVVVMAVVVLVVMLKVLSAEVMRSAAWNSVSMPSNASAAALRLLFLSFFFPMSVSR